MFEVYRLVANGDCLQHRVHFMLRKIKILKDLCNILNNNFGHAYYPERDETIPEIVTLFYGNLHIFV